MREIRKTLITAGIVSMALFSADLQSKAVNIGSDKEEQEGTPARYTRDLAEAIGRWVDFGENKKFLCLDGSYIANAWIESLIEQGHYDYVGADGVVEVK